MTYVNFENKLLDESWKFLNPSEEEVVVRELLYDFVRILLDRNEDVPQRVSDLERLKECIELKNDVKVKTDWGCIEMVKEYAKLMENQKVYIFAKNKEKIEVDGKKQFEQEFGFRPSINKKSKELQGENSEISRYECLYRNYQEKEVKILCSKLTALEEELNECSFAPKILNTSHNSSYSIKNDAKNPIEKKTTMQSYMEKELEHCTFAPKITKEIIKKVSDKPRGFDEFIKKSRKVIKEKIEQKAKESRPFGENYKKNRFLKSEPPSFLDRQKEAKNILIYIDVNVAPGKKGKIALREGDSADQLAENFCKVYGLGKDYQEHLEEALALQINELQNKNI